MAYLSLGQLQRIKTDICDLLLRYVPSKDAKGLNPIGVVIPGVFLLCLIAKVIYSINWREKGRQTHHGDFVFEPSLLRIYAVGCNSTSGIFAHLRICGTSRT
jgi:hypothetical protein